MKLLLPVALDGAQAVGNMPVDVNAYGCDFYTTSGHKWLIGPKRTGIFYVREDALDILRPTTVGAYSEQKYDLSQRELTFHLTAQRYEYATQNEPLMLGLGTAIDFLNDIGTETIWTHNKRLAEMSYRGLREIPGVEILSLREEEYRTSLITFRMPGHNYREVAPSGEYGAFRADIFHNRVVVRNEKKSSGQPYFEILRNSGAYNDDVRTSRIDFQSFPEIEYSRTRLEDLRNHYRWDRTLLRHRKEEYFLMVDALKFFRSDYYTVVNLLHTRKILERGENWYLTRIDRLAGEYPNPGDLNLLVIFLREKERGVQKEWRDLQEEVAVFQGESRYYDAGLVESFVTILYPLEPDVDPEGVVRRFRLLSDSRKGISVRVDSGATTKLYGVKLDLDMDLLAEDVRPRYTYESGKVTYGSVETDADMFFMNTSGASPRYSATNLVRFVYGENVLFDAPESNFFQVWGRSDHVGRAKWRRWGNY